MAGIVDPSGGTINSQCAIFLDRDGTLIEDRGFLRKPSEVHLIPDVIESLRLLADRYLLFIVTNQTGVGEGALTMREVDTVNRHLLVIFATQGVDIAGVFVCPHTRAENCVCIKPKPYQPVAEVLLTLSRPGCAGPCRLVDG